MAPSTRFTKIWRLKNTGEVAWPPGTKMLFVGGDQMTSEMVVPLSRATAVQPGEEVDVAVEMVAPTELGRYLGYWRLTGPHGRRKFGQRVWCHVQVVDPAAAPEEDVTDGLAMDATAKEILLKKQSLAAAEPDADDAGMADEDDVDVSADGAVATHKEAVVEAPKEAAAPAEEPKAVEPAAEPAKPAEEAKPVEGPKA